jgi:Uma2 family endonuclease
VVIVEILSPPTGRKGQGRELADYFRLPSVARYLIIDPDDVLVIHHQRHGEDILTRILREGTITLDPPGIEVKVAEIYGGGGYSPAST